MPLPFLIKRREQTFYLFTRDPSIIRIFPDIQASRYKYSRNITIFAYTSFKIFFFFSLLAYESIESNKRIEYSYRFTQIAVDPQVKTPGGKTYDVLFIGTDNGKVIKAVNAESADTHLKVSPVVIEEIQAFPSTVPVRGIKVVRASQAGDGLEDGRLVVIADSQVQALRLHRCYSDRILSCGECVALQDPYCAWDKVEGKCRALVGPAATDASRFLQSVATGLHASCPPSKSLNKDAGSVGAISANQNKFPPDSMIPNKEGQGGEIINIMQDEEQDNSGRYWMDIGRKMYDKNFILTLCAPTLRHHLD